MKTKVLLVFSLFLLTQISTAQYVDIQDQSFRNFLKVAYPTCFNSQNMLDTTCSAVLNATSLNCNGRGIADLQGILYFKKLTTLDYSNNLLTSLPALPSTLKYLDCSINKLASLAALPNSLTTLKCYNNKLTSLPVLPSTLTTLWCYDNMTLFCLPILPSGLTFLNASYTSITCLPNRPFSLSSALPTCTTSSPCVLGIEVNSEMQLIVSPNPATENCQVDYDTQGKQGALTLTDALGRTVKSVELHGSSQHEFSVADMPTGLYYLRVKIEGQTLATSKLVIQK